MTRANKSTLILLPFLGVAQVFLALSIGQLPSPVIPPQAAHVRNPQLFATLSFGHLPLAIDWLWLATLQNDSTERLPEGQHDQLYSDLNLVTDLDGAFFEAYEAGANLLAVVRSDGVGAKELLLKGDRFRKSELPKMPESFKQRFWSRAWSIPVLLGYTYLFELNDLPSAAVHFREAATVPGAPPYLQSLADRLAKPGGEYAVGLRLINYLISGATDDRVREELTRKRESLYLAQYLADLNRSFGQFLLARPSARESLASRWKTFVRENGIALKDPWGGVLSLSDAGKIVSSTPHVRVFGLE